MSLNQQGLTTPNCYSIEPGYLLITTPTSNSVRLCDRLTIIAGVEKISIPCVHLPVNPNRKTNIWVIITFEAKRELRWNILYCNSQTEDELWLDNPTFISRVFVFLYRHSIILKLFHSPYFFGLDTTQTQKLWTAEQCILYLLKLRPFVAHRRYSVP